MLQDDHYFRICELSFQHLQASFESAEAGKPHAWVKNVKNDDPRFGRIEYLQSFGMYQKNVSNEYSHAIATLLFTHIWLLSAANYYRLSVKHRQPRDALWLSCTPITETDSPHGLARALKLPARVVDCAETLHRIRNTVCHLVETDKKTERIDEIEFAQAYMHAKNAWTIYNALLRHHKQRPDLGSWSIQTSRYGLPRRLHHAQQ